MHGTSAGVPVPLSGIGGLVTLADSESVPEGASPRTYDTDYLVGKAKTRAGLAVVYSFADGKISKLPTRATDIATGGVVWTNPAGVEGDSSFASVVFGPANQTKPPASVVSQGAGIPWVDPQNAATGGTGGGIGRGTGGGAGSGRGAGAGGGFGLGPLDGQRGVWSEGLGTQRDLPGDDS